MPVSFEVFRGLTEATLAFSSDKTRVLQGARVQRALHFHSPPLVWEAWQKHVCALRTPAVILPPPIVIACIRLSTLL